MNFGGFGGFAHIKAIGEGIQKVTQGVLTDV